MKVITKAKWRPNIIRYRERIVMLSGEVLIVKRTKIRWHKARVPGTIRMSRAPGGSGFRGWEQWFAHNGARHDVG